MKVSIVMKFVTLSAVSPNLLSQYQLSLLREVLSLGHLKAIVKPRTIDENMLMYYVWR